MGKIKLLHGSDHIIEKPDLLLGKTNNDYGRGFYCTQELSMAMEWACKKNSDGFVNKYVLEQDSLNILNLLDGKYNILHWMALLLKNRTFRLSNEIAIDACDYIIENFSIDLKGEKGTLVIFMCNHCPFVLHVIDKLTELYEDYHTQGIEFIAINANDVEKYPADSPEKMIEFQIERKFEFPYLFDESQAVAKAYDAACTPDFYFFDEKLDLVYRGQMDDSRPGNQKEITGEDLIIAFENLLSGNPQEELQKPSMGCNIKWK